MRFTRLIQQTLFMMKLLKVKKNIDWSLFKTQLKTFMSVSDNPKVTECSGHFFNSFGKKTLIVSKKMVNFVSKIPGTT